MTWDDLMRSGPVKCFTMPIICIAAGVAGTLWLVLSESIEDSQFEVRFTNLQDVVGSQHDLYNKAIAE
jgi:hypothetical protein